MTRFARPKFIILICASALTVALAFAPATALAQSSTAESDDISLYLGEMLPTAIDHVTEIMPAFGFRYGIGTDKLGHVDLGLFNSKAYGAEFSTAEVSLRGETSLSAGLDAVYYGGLDLNYYKPDITEDRNTVMGYHAGAGAMMSVTDNLWLRGDIKIMGGPGTTLQLLFGFVFRTAGSSSN